MVKIASYLWTYQVALLLALVGMFYMLRETFGTLGEMHLDTYASEKLQVRKKVSMATQGAVRCSVTPGIEEQRARLNNYKQRFEICVCCGSDRKTTRRTVKDCKNIYNLVNSNSRGRQNICSN